MGSGGEAVAACRLEAQVALASAVRGFCQAVLQEGKDIAKGAALREALLSAALLLKTASDACDRLLLRLAAQIADEGLPEEEEEPTACGGRAEDGEGGCRAASGQASPKRSTAQHHCLAGSNRTRNLLCGKHTPDGNPNAVLCERIGFAASSLYCPDLCLEHPCSVSLMHNGTPSRRTGSGGHPVCVFISHRSFTGTTLSIFDVQVGADPALVWQLAAMASSGASLAAACRKVLAWRRQKCPSRAREPAAALDSVCDVFEARWSMLADARRGDTGPCIVSTGP